MTEDVDFTWVVRSWQKMLILHERCGHDRRCWFLHERCDCDGQGGDLECSQYMEAPWSSSLYLKKWFRTTKAIVLYLSDGTLQVRASPSKGVQLHTYFAWAVVSAVHLQPTCSHLKHDARGRNWSLPHENRPSFLWFKNKTEKTLSLVFGHVLLLLLGFIHWHLALFLYF